MPQTAYLFPDAAARHPGMGRALCERFSVCRELYACASDIFGFDVAALSFSGRAAELADPAVAFPVVFTCSLAAHAAARELLPAPDALAGYSAGELTALTAAGIYSPEDGCRAALAYTRLAADAQNAGDMVRFRVNGCPQEAVEKATNMVFDGFVQAVAFEAPGQAVLLGDTGGLAAALDALEKQGAHAQKLPERSALHSFLAAPYTANLQRALAELPVGELSLPFYSNLYGGKIDKMTRPADYFSQQQISPLLFAKGIAAMQADGIGRFVVLGGDKTLANAVKAVARGARVLCAEDPKALEKLREA